MGIILTFCEKCQEALYYVGIMIVEQLAPKIFDFNPSLEPTIGLGVDIIEINRVGTDVEQTPGFAEEFCSLEEIIYCDSAIGEERRQRYARLFSLKEAAIKSLGGSGNTGQEPELDWREIIVREEGINSPFINLTGRAKKRADQLRITSLSVIFTEVKRIPIVLCIAFGQHP